MKQFIEDLTYALDKFDWGNSPLDAKAIKILNEWKINLNKILKERDQKVVEIIENRKVYRNAFILKRELINKLEEAFPEK